MNRILKQNTGVTILIGQLFNWADSKTLLYEALGGNNYTPSTLVLTISKGATQSTLTLTLSGGTNNFNLLADGMASLVLTTGNTDTCGDFIITLTNATVGSEVVFPCKFEFTILSAEMYDKLMGTGNLAVLLTSAYDAAKTAAPTTTQIRTELATELGRIDAAISTRSTLAAGAEMALTSGAIASVQSGVAKTSELATVLSTLEDDLDHLPPPDLSAVAKTTELASVKLAADGLDNIPVTEATGRPTTFRTYLLALARRFMNKSKLTTNHLTIYKDNGVDVASVQDVAESTGEQNIGAVP